MKFPQFRIEEKANVQRQSAKIKASCLLLWILIRLVHFYVWKFSAWCKKFTNDFKISWFILENGFTMPHPVRLFVYVVVGKLFLNAVNCMDFILRNVLRNWYRHKNVEKFWATSHQSLFSSGCLHKLECMTHKVSCPTFQAGLRKQKRMK